MCGGDIQVGVDKTYGTCDSCGSTMTLPNINEERLINLFNRANHYRQQNEFDKALATYESILSEDGKNAEAHWGVVLSKYGIEYVEDPKTHERVPTCHRAQTESILSDFDYKAALENSSDGYTQSLYEQEAQQIAEIQKGILAVSCKEKPYDVFICYKETDATGQRTVDSTIAQDIYYQLDKENLRVFFARISLEDVLGKEYEPYIFAALNSAKVMLVVGTKQEHFNAVWVRNEWSRFMALTKKDREKVIIPCYRDMDAYDLPDELSMFQSQDMSKIGFIQDLVRGIKKITSVKEQASQSAINTATDFYTQTEALLKRAFLLLEDAEWEKAQNLLEQILNIDPENAKAYVGMLMSEIKVNKEENLSKRAVNLFDYPNFNKALKFANESYRTILLEYKKSADDKLELRQKKEEEKLEIHRKQERQILINEYNIAVKKAEELLKRKRNNKILCLFSLAIMLVSLIFIMSFWQSSINSGNIFIPIFGMLSGIVAFGTALIAGVKWADKNSMYKKNLQNIREKQNELKRIGVNVN